MGRFKQYGAEFGLIGATSVIGALGFWNIYLGPSADPQPHHHLHIATTYLWLGLLFAQLAQLARGNASRHRRLGLAVLAAGPLLVASAALLTVHSAQRAIASGEPDFLIVQNVVGTVWLALVLFLAFALKRRRKLHGALLMSTLVLFLGPALFFALLAFAPPFRIEGPETFYRFQTAAMTGQAIIAVVVLAMLLRDRRNNWPYLLAGGSYLVAEAAKAWLTHLELIDPLTRLVATPGKAAAFLVALALVAVLLAASVWPRGNGRHPSRPVAVAADVAGDRAV
ncbi:hypothetical protein LY632_01915 [Erythrobacter sp. SDW2]|uniref:hypothetical protein n=1 Tax=Erythrobacter sp. SDW2 TaxID=2907154 RepID=UPI001F1E9EFB|nr:hypothetical protein [Erythrobacter sp. SDW2]UIP07183.1 hypothetical protein LY632_01915 [Erythrobacter sp. SDW2]